MEWPHYFCEYETWLHIIKTILDVIGINLFCVIKSTVHEASKSQINDKMFTDLYILALLSNW